MNFDPIHWAAAGLGVALVLVLSIGGTMYWKQGQDLKVCHADFSAFVANTKAEGLKGQLANQGKEHDLAMAAVNIQGELNEKQVQLNRVYANYNRLRHAKTDSGNSESRSLSEAARTLSCPDARAGFAEHLELLEGGVLERLLKSRDEAINRNIACKQYIETIQSIMNKETP